MDKIKNLISKQNNTQLTPYSEILEKLPDELFRYGWQDYKRDLKIFTDQFTIERAIGSAATVATENGLVFEPNVVTRGPVGKFLNFILPGGRGHRGEVNIQAIKTRTIHRNISDPGFEPVASEDFLIQEIDTAQQAEYHALFPQFFNNVNF